MSEGNLEDSLLIMHKMRSVLSEHSDDVIILDHWTREEDKEPFYRLWEVVPFRKLRFKVCNYAEMCPTRYRANSIRQQTYLNASARQWTFDRGFDAEYVKSSPWLHLKFGVEDYDFAKGFGSLFTLMDVSDPSIGDDVWAALIHCLNESGRDVVLLGYGDRNIAGDHQISFGTLRQNLCLASLCENYIGRFNLYSMSVAGRSNSAFLTSYTPDDVNQRTFPEWKSEFLPEDWDVARVCKGLTKRNC
tara:strand:+ start:1 stop:738 length:738 start_codon:yes stop_codon:yes gene_type:complete